MSQLGRKIRQKLAAQVDFLTQFPGDIVPDVAVPGVQMPYLVITSADGIPEHGLNGVIMHIRETVTIEVVATTRAQAEDRLDWIREKLKGTSWTTVPVDSYRVNFWRVDNHSDRADAVLDGDDSLTRYVTLTVTGSTSKV